MGRKITPRKILNYVMFVIVAMMAYKVFFQGEKKKDFDQHDYHPKNQPREYDPNDDPKSKVKEINKHKDTVRYKKDSDEKQNGGHDVKDKQKHSRDAHVKASDKETQIKKDKINKSADKLRHQDSDSQKHDGHKENREGQKISEGGKEKTKHKNGSKDDHLVLNAPLEELKPDARAERRKKLHKVDFDLDGDDFQTAKEKNERRKGFFKHVSEVKEDYDAEGEDEHFHERDDDLTFATAVWSDNYLGALQLVESVQRLFPRSEIGLFDIGLTAEERKKLGSLCRVEVHRTLLMHFPQHMQDLSRNLWRPFVLQMALGTYGHVIYIEPERKLVSIADFKGFMAQSRIGGVSIIGYMKDYSTYVVTHPDMYHYLATDTKKLQRIKHVDITMIVIHNTAPVRMRFMRWLYSCGYEEWCIAPPGARMTCDHRQHAHSRLWANCHRYDESAINILLATWHKYELKHYARRDTLTSPYDGHDVTNKLQYCRTRQGDL